MKIVVLGASQGTGALAVKAALDRGHQVTAFARSPDKLALTHASLTRLAGNFHDAASVDGAVRGHDAVIITASATKLSAFREQPRYFSLGTGFTIDAMKKHGVRRLAVLSALGTGDSRDLVPWPIRKIMIDWLLKEAFADHVRQEAQVRESGLDWVVARPGRLTDGPARGRYVTKTEIEPVPAAMSRADVADFLVKACDTDAWVGKTVQIGG